MEVSFKPSKSQARNKAPRSFELPASSLLSLGTADSGTQRFVWVESLFGKTNRRLKLLQRLETDPFCFRGNKYAVKRTKNDQLAFSENEQRLVNSRNKIRFVGQGATAMHNSQRGTEPGKPSVSHPLAGC